MKVIEIAEFVGARQERHKKKEKKQSEMEKKVR